jgi:hypothetical protein
MILGHASVNMFYIWAIAIVILGGLLFYGISRTGRLRRSERAQLDDNTRAAHRRDDPQKH